MLKKWLDPDQYWVFWVLVTDEVVMTIIVFTEVITVRAVVPVLIVKACHVIYHFLGWVDAPHLGQRQKPMSSQLGR